MKSRILGLCALSSLALAGCASNDVAVRPSPDPLLKADAEYMLAVEKASKRLGTRVVWVNPPRVSDRTPRPE